MASRQLHKICTGPSTRIPVEIAGMNELFGLSVGTCWRNPDDIFVIPFAHELLGERLAGGRVGCRPNLTKVEWLHNIVRLGTCTNISASPCVTVLR